MSDRRAVAALALTLLAGCGPTKLLRLENQVLQNQVTELRAEVEACERDAPPPDYANHVTVDVVRDYMTRAGYAPSSQPSPSILALQVKGENHAFQLNVQLFEREKVLFMAITDYITIEQATSSSAMVLLLTQLAAMNYELLLGKFQLNPASGEVSLSVELNLEDGLGFRTFGSVLNHLLKTADSKYPDLVRATQGQGL